MKLLVRIANSETTATLDLSLGVPDQLQEVQTRVFRLFDPSGSFITTMSHTIKILDSVGNILDQLRHPVQLNPAVSLRIDPIAQLQQPAPTPAFQQPIPPPAYGTTVPVPPMPHEATQMTYVAPPLPSFDGGFRLPEKRAKMEEGGELVRGPSQAALRAFEARLLDYYRWENSRDQRPVELRHEHTVVADPPAVLPPAETPQIPQGGKDEANASLREERLFPEAMKLKKATRQSFKDGLHKLFGRNGNQWVRVEDILPMFPALGPKVVKSLLALYSDAQGRQQHFVESSQGFKVNENQGYFAGKLAVVLKSKSKKKLAVEHRVMADTVGSPKFIMFAQKCAQLPRSHPYAFVELSKSGYRIRDNMSNDANTTFVRAIGGNFGNLQEHAINVL